MLPGLIFSYTQRNRQIHTHTHTHTPINQVVKKCRMHPNVEGTTKCVFNAEAASEMAPSEPYVDLSAYLDKVPTLNPKP